MFFNRLHTLFAFVFMLFGSYQLLCYTNTIKYYVDFGKVLLFGRPGAQWSGNHYYVHNIGFLARDIIYTSRAYAVMPVCLSVCDGSALAHYS